jgi:nicotinate-nucleotide adenylyltransferase
MRLSEAAIGLLGGTFDPFHRAHLQLALDAQAQLGLAQITLIPAGSPPLRDEPGTAAAHRLEMVRRAIAGLPGLKVDDCELHPPGPSYTVDTLRRQRQEHGAKQSLVLLLGTDAFTRLPAWHRWRELFDLAHLAVATRPGYALEPEGELAAEYAARRGTASDLTPSPAGRIVAFAMTPLDISATAIREQLAQNRDVSHLVPPAVLGYIQSHHLYQAPHGHQEAAKNRRHGA